MHASGIHHITAISSNAQKTYDFYTQILGLRLVKKTVNFDAPDVYHLYFGNASGEPGTILTFFPFEDAGTGMRGRGQVTKIYFAVPMQAIGFWLDRFVTKGIRHEHIKSRFEERYITFFDPDGLQLEIVGTKDDLSISPWQTKDIAAENAICGFYGAELAVESRESIEPLLSDVLGYKFKSQEELLVRFENMHASHAKYIDLLLMQGWPEGIQSAGTNHHIAFRVEDKVEQENIREEVIRAGYLPTEIVDRNYFTSIYFREHNHILFEVATDEPGFTIDESLETLGESLKLPPQFEARRQFIENILPPLHVGGNTKLFETSSAASDLDLFEHKFVDNGAAITYVLFHGTGGNEMQMIGFAEELGIKANILSVRGNTRENGMNRFFVRFPDGSFDEQPLSFLGYSNGANFALAYVFLYPIKLEKLFALHPMVPLEKSENSMKDVEIFVTFGEHDEYSKADDMKRLEQIVIAAGGKVVLKKFAGKHAISEREIEYLSNLS